MSSATLFRLLKVLRCVQVTLVFIAPQQALCWVITCQEAILHISNGGTEREYCIVHNHSWTPLATSLDDAKQYPLVTMTSTVLCNASEITPDVVKGKALVVMRGDCDFSQKALNAQNLGATTLLIASNKSLITPSANDSEYSKVQIPLALMRYRDFLEAQQVFGKEMQVRLYAPPHSKIDPSIAVILLISIVTVVLGGYWSGACESHSLTEHATAARVFVFFSMFSVSSSFSVRNCNISVRSLILAAVCITIAVIWGVYRNEERWIWILQDLLGIAFCLNFMKTISLSNFKICVILLSLLLVYDVFFVFITPFFTKNGVSIMVQVALGPDASGEKLPVVMRVPRFSAWAQNLCGMQFSILGYGDIIVPGLLVAYCSRFDVWINSSKKIYFVSCCIAYLLGMILTFAVMLLSGMGQPALLYLVPFTLITSAVVAGCRGEIKQFWSGTTYRHILNIY
uniref:PA domain-containing protein n=1 Tax=Anabas testudineus TaxID=64144 RepID=A0A7N6BYW1_ANATE